MDPFRSNWDRARLYDSLQAGTFKKRLISLWISHCGRCIRRNQRTDSVLYLFYKISETLLFCAEGTVAARYLYGTV